MNRMEGIEPSAGLVHAFGNEIRGRAELGLSERTQAFLCIRHCTRIEPDVDKVALTYHLLA